MVPTDLAPSSEIEQILDVARRAPSGDNRQPWRFELVSSEEARIHIRADESDVYDLDGRPTLLSVGCLLETLRLAASRFGRRAVWSLETLSVHQHRISVCFPKDGTVAAEPHADFITKRAVDRRRYRATPLTPQQMAALQAAVGPDYQLRWYTTFGQRLSLTALTVRTTAIRLRLPEAFPVHQAILDFTNRFSEHAIPADALGTSRPLTLAIGWVLQRWWRMLWLGRLGGLWGAYLQMDIVPGLACAGHFALVRHDGAALSVDVGVRDGIALQRLWLAATEIGLVLQPNLSPRVMATYAEKNLPFTRVSSLRRRAQKVRAQLLRLLCGARLDDTVTLGRIGQPIAKPLTSRASRRPLRALMLQHAQGALHDDRLSAALHSQSAVATHGTAASDAIESLPSASRPHAA